MTVTQIAQHAASTVVLLYTLEQLGRTMTYQDMIKQLVIDEPDDFHKIMSAARAIMTAAGESPDRIRQLDARLTGPWHWDSAASPVS